MSLPKRDPTYKPPLRRHLPDPGGAGEGHALSFFLEEPLGDPRLMQSDGRHPNEAGSDYIAAPNGAGRRARVAHCSTGVSITDARRIEKWLLALKSRRAKKHDAVIQFPCRKGRTSKTFPAAEFGRKVPPGLPEFRIRP